MLEALFARQSSVLKRCRSDTCTRNMPKRRPLRGGGFLLLNYCGTLKVPSSDEELIHQSSSSFDHCTVEGARTDHLHTCILAISLKRREVQDPPKQSIRVGVYPGGPSSYRLFNPVGWYHTPCVRFSQGILFLRPLKVRYRQSINWVCKMLKSTLAISSVSFCRQTFEWVSCRFIKKRPINRWNPQKLSAANSFNKVENSIINFSRSEFPADFSAKETCKNDTPAN